MKKLEGYITSYRIDLLGRKIDFPKISGYKKHYNSFIRETDIGRFHMTEGLDSYTVHFDVYLDNNKNHMTLPSKEILQKEVKRLINKIKHIPYKKQENKVFELNLKPLCVSCKKEMNKKGKCKECKNKDRLKKNGNK